MEDLINYYRKAYKFEKDKVWDYINSLIELAKDSNEQIRNENSIGNINIAEKLYFIAENAELGIDKYWVTSVSDFIKRDYRAYLKNTEKYIKIYTRKNSFDYDTAYWIFFDILWEINCSDKTNINNCYKNIHKILLKYCRNSVIELYFKSLFDLSDASFKKVLKKVIERDDKWYSAYTDLGDIYYNEEDYKNAYDSYKYLLDDNVDLPDYCYFRIAWAAGTNKVKDYKTEEFAYKKYIELNPEPDNIAYAYNNLGHCLVKQKRYEEAINYFDISIDLDNAGFHPYRNKFDTLLKLNKIDEAIELAKSYPEYFKTKYYREKIQELKEKSSIDIDLDEFLNKIVDSDNAGTMIVSEKGNISLYDHQRKAIEKMSNDILNSNDYAGLLVLPTGGGKTITASYWLMRDILDKGGKIIWLAHRHELLNQAEKAFEKVCCESVSKNKKQYNWRIISGQHDKPVNIKANDDIVIASKTSIKRGINYFIDNWLNKNKKNVFLVIDEAHHSTASEYREIIKIVQEYAEHFKMLGLTATPFRTSKKEKGLLKKIFKDDIVYKIDLRELIKQGILSEPHFEQIKTNVNMAEMFRENGGENILERIANEGIFDIDNIGKDLALLIAENKERNNLIVKQYKENKEKYGQTIVFAQSVDMAVVLNKLFNDEGIKSGYVISTVKDSVTGVTISSDENEKTINKYRNNELDVIINVNILTEGTDLPKTKTVFLTRPTKSTILMTQMIGRALRGVNAGGTEEAYIVSFIDDWENKIAWVNPEQLYIDETLDFTDYDYKKSKKITRLISIQKIEEFAKILNNTVDENILNISSEERMPIGIYSFSYLMETNNEDEIDKNCTILVFDCMEQAYKNLADWITHNDIDDVISVSEHIEKTLFGVKERLLGHSKGDIVDFIQYYKKTGEIPEMYYWNERKDFNITAIADRIREMDSNVKRNEMIKEEWNKNGAKWKAFVNEIDSEGKFARLINIEINRMDYPDDYKCEFAQPLTKKEEIKLMDLSLNEMGKRYPEKEQAIRNAVFAKYTDSEGYYYSTESGYRSKNRLDFDIDHIIPMSKGGKTTMDNLQLLTRNENRRMSDKNKLQLEII